MTWKYTVDESSKDDERHLQGEGKNTLIGDN